MTCVKVGDPGGSQWLCRMCFPKHALGFQQPLFEGSLPNKPKLFYSEFWSIKPAQPIF